MGSPLLTTNLAVGDLALGGGGPFYLEDIGRLFSHAIVLLQELGELDEGQIPPIHFSAAIKPFHTLLPPCPPSH